MKYVIENQDPVPFTEKTDRCYHFFLPLSYVDPEKNPDLAESYKYLFGDLIRRTIYVFSVVYPYGFEGYDVCVLPRYFEPGFSKFLKAYRRWRLEKKFKMAMEALEKAETIEEFLKKAEEIGFAWNVKYMKDCHPWDCLEPIWTPLWARERDVYFKPNL